MLSPDLLVYKRDVAGGFIVVWIVTKGGRCGKSTWSMECGRFCQMDIFLGCFYKLRLLYSSATNSFNLKSAYKIR